MNFLTALKNCQTHKTPWHYITLQNPLTDEQIVEIKNANIVTNQKSNDGTRSGCNTDILDKDKKFRDKEVLHEISKGKIGAIFQSLNHQV